MSGFHVVAVEGDVPAEALIRSVYGLNDGASLRPRGTGEFPGSASEGTAGVAHVGGWTVVAGGFPASLGSDDEAAALARLSRGRRLFRWAEESTSGSVGMDCFADGEQLRGFWSVEGEVVSSVGSPLAGEPDGGFEEADQGDVDVWAIVEVLEPYVGPWDAIGEAEYQMYEFDRA